MNQTNKGDMMSKTVVGGQSLGVPNSEMDMKFGSTIMDEEEETQSTIVHQHSIAKESGNNLGFSIKN